MSLDAAMAEVKRIAEENCPACQHGVGPKRLPSGHLPRDPRPRKHTCKRQKAAAIGLAKAEIEDFEGILKYYEDDITLNGREHLAWYITNRKAELERLEGGE
jgi:hypothetical protein